MPSVFTRIIHGELAGRFLWRDELCVVFLSIAPLRPGHALVVPRVEVDHWIDLPPETATHLMAVAQVVGKAQQVAFEPARIGLMIAGFEVPDAGQILLGGQVVSGGGRFVAPQRRRVGYVPQEGALFPHLDVAANIAFGLARARRRSGDRVGDLLELLGLSPSLATRYPHELSGGQQQRVACARALVAKPAVIFADEPTGNLDSKSSTELLGFLRRSVDDLGQSVVMVTHDPRAATYAHRVLFLADGRLVAELTNPTQASVLEILGSLSSVDDAASARELVAVGA